MTRYQNPPLFAWGNFVANSGQALPFKIECDALTDEDIECVAQYVASTIRFRNVVGVPRGGLRLAAELGKYVGVWDHDRLDDYLQFPPLIVDDVLTTGDSMERMRVGMNWPKAVGFVIFDRSGICTTASWIKSFWRIG